MLINYIYYHYFGIRRRDVEQWISHRHLAKDLRTLLEKHVSTTLNLSRFSKDRCRKINGGIFEIKYNFLKRITTVF